MMNEIMKHFRSGSSHSALAPDSDSEYLEPKAKSRREGESNTEQRTCDARDLRQNIFKRLIVERLHCLGLSYKEASGIAKTWSSGYVMPRALPVQIPNSRMPIHLDTSSEQIHFFHPAVHTTFSGTEIETHPSKLPAVPYTKPVQSLFRKMDTIIGILNSAICAIVEAQYLLVLPHLNIGDPKPTGTGFHDYGYDCNYMKNWVDMIYLAAHQLDITNPKSVFSLVDNELKPMKKSFVEASRICKAVHRNLKTLVTDVDDFRMRLVGTIRQYTNWPPQFLERRVKPDYNSDYVQMLNFPVSALYENFMSIRVASDYGLFLKHKTEPGWNAFSNMKTLDKQLVFMSMVDHAKTTLDSVVSTLGHLKELYTPGYPTNIRKRMECLRSILWHEFESLKDLPLRTKLEIHAKMDQLITSLERLTHVYVALGIKLRDGKKKVKQMVFNTSSKKTVEFVKNKSATITDSHIIIPFVSLPMHELSDHEDSDPEPHMLITRTLFSEVTEHVSNM